MFVPRPRRLRVEPLEGRLVPTYFTVTTTADVVSAADHRLSLREAVTAANTHPGPDVIQLQAGVYRIALPEGAANDNAGGDFDVTGPLTIRGRGAGLTAVDGGGRNRLFDLVGTFDAAFRGLNLRNGGGPVNGAAVQAADANVTLTGCVVTGNRAFQGGGIDAEHGNVTLVRTTIAGNRSLGDGGGVHLGTGALQLRDSAVRGNLAGDSGGGIATAGPVTLTRSTVTGNVAIPVTAGGGGIYANSVTLTASTVTGNVAGAAGGGILAATTVVLTGCRVSGNLAGDAGGGIAANDSVTLIRSTVAGNAAGAAGGGVAAPRVTVDASFVTGNSTPGAGGGINATHDATLNRSVVADNRAGGDGGGVSATAATLTASTVRGNSTVRHGGGVFADAIALFSSTVSGNAATGPAGAGGGVWALNATLLNTTISGNRAQLQGGGIDAAGATVLNCTIAENSALSGGGAIHEGTTRPFSVRNTIIARNLADANGTGPDVFGHFDTGGHNLIGDPTGGTGSFLVDPTDQVGVTGSPLDPRLGPLANNGGPTQTHTLLAGSPAIDHGDNAVTKEITEVRLTADQRGYPRVKDGNGDGRAVIDIGAFER